VKDKTAATVFTAYKKIVTEAGGNPLELISDNGGEFTSNAFQNYLKTEQVFHFTVEPDYHKTLGIVDRLCRTIKEKLFKYFTDKKTTNWIDIIDKIMETYNDSPHSSLGDITPNDVEDNRQFVIELNKKKITNVSNHKFKIGSIVRIKLKGSIFKKGYKQQYSTETYTIESINGMNAKLDDGESAELNDLQVVDKHTDLPQAETEKVEKQAKVSKILKQVGVSEANETQEKRIRKPRTILDL
jgi:hypothetical protein